MMNSDDSAALHARLLGLFEGPFAGVRFPDVDAEILSAQLCSAKAAAARLEEARTALEAARHALAEEETKLESRTERALAYLRVYAAGDPVLLVELEALSDHTQPRSAPAPMTSSVRRRARPVRASEVLALAPPAETIEPEALVTAASPG